MMKRRLLVLLTVVMAVSMILAACGGGAAQPTTAPVAEQPTTAPAAEQPTAAPAAEEPAADAPMSVGASAEGAGAKGLTELAAAYGGEYKGKVVTMTGPFTDEDAVKFESSAWFSGEPLYLYN
ncbi:MAG: hypothetical protein WAZ19_10780 [Anaerolineae bacterium]